jgi:hypothetical protein
LRPLEEDTSLPSPKIWSTRDQLVADLAIFPWRKEVERTEKAAAGDWEDVISRSVASNTFRAFHRMPQRPSEVFRTWALDAFVHRGFLKSLSIVSTRSEYDVWLTALVQDFQNCWQSRMGKEVPYGPAYKLPNLLLKCVALRPELPRSQRGQLVEWLHVPLDSYTIQALRGWLTLPDGGRIPSGATMKFIRDANLYESLQSEIKGISGLAHVPPIAFDYLAWDASHRNHQREI